MAKKSHAPAKGPSQPALEVVQQFLHHTIDKPNEAKAKALLTATSLASGSFHMQAELIGAKYTVADPQVEGSQTWVNVAITAGGQTMTVPFAPVQEDGQWKLDMNATMEKMMGGMMEAAVGQMAQAVGKVMEGVGQALGAAFGESASPSPENDGSTPQIDPAALEEFKTDVLGQIEKETRDKIDMDLPLVVDYAGLLTSDDPAENARLLGVLKDRVLSNWSYWIREVNQHVPLQDRVKAVRLEGVRDARERAIFAEGARIIYRLNLSEDAGSYEGADLASRLAGVAAGMAESAPPTDVLSRGPSYRPSGDGTQIMANYSEFVLPALTTRIAEMLGRELPIEGDWERFGSESANAAGLWAWGVNRICGAIGLLMAVPEVREMRSSWSSGLKSVRLFGMTDPAMKSVKMEGDELWIYIAPAAGEEGCFYETDIAEAISQGLKLRLRPMIAELERYAKTWENSLEETFGRPIKFAIDFDTFSGHPDESKSIFALTLLREHGIDRLYYALTAVAEKNPNFKQQVPKRIAWLYLESVPTPEAKGVDGEQTTIRYRLFLFEGYNGYLTQKELEGKLPAIVAGMPDQDWEAPAEPAAEPVPAEEPQEPASEPAPEPAPESVDPQAEAFANLQAQMQAMLPTYSQQLQQMLGQAFPFEIAWDTLGHQLEAVGQLLNAALSPVLGGLGMLSQDAAIRHALGTRVDKIVLRQAAAPQEHGFSLRNRILTFSAYLTPALPTMDPQSAANVLRQLLVPASGESVVLHATFKKKPPAKPTPAAKTAAKKAAPKKPAPGKSTPTKPAPKKKRR